MTLASCFFNNIGFCFLVMVSRSTIDQSIIHTLYISLRTLKWNDIQCYKTKVIREFIWFKCQSTIRLQFISVRLRNQTRIHSWDQPVLHNEGKVFFSRKQQEPLKVANHESDALTFSHFLMYTPINCKITLHCCTLAFNPKWKKTRVENLQIQTNKWISVKGFQRLTETTYELTNL